MATFDRLLVILIGFSLFSSILRTPSSVLAEGESNGPESLDVIIVMDNSRSNEYTDPENLRQHFTRALFHLFSADSDFTPTRIGMIFFGTTATLWNGRLFNANELELPGIQFPKADGLTVIDRPFRLAYQTLLDNGSFDGKHASAVIFLTDGRPEEDEINGPQTEEVAELFRRSEPWVKKFAENDTRLYIISYAGGVTLQEERWQEFAELTGGRYETVASVEEAVEIYTRVIMEALLGYNPIIDLPRTEMDALEVKEVDIKVLPATNRLLVFAMHLNPGTRVELHRHRKPDNSLGELVGDAESNVLVRGGGAGEMDKIWRIDYPEEGIWTLVFQGGPSVVEAWHFYRIFNIKLMEPSPLILQRPGQPLRIRAILLDHLEKQSIKGSISEIYPIGMTLKVVGPPPRYATSAPILMDYDLNTGSFSTTYTQNSVEGGYLLQFVLSAGKITLAKGEENIYVGYTPLLVNVEIKEAVPNTIAGFQPGEPLIMRVNLTGIESAAPPGFNKIEAQIRSETGQEILLRNSYFRPESVENYSFISDLPSLQETGDYTGTIWISGETTTGIAFGGQREIKIDFDFRLIPYPLPELLDVTTSSPNYWYSPLTITTVVKRYLDTQSPTIQLELLDSHDQPVERVELDATTEQMNKDFLKYSWKSRSIRKWGNYRIRITLVGGIDNTREYPLSVEFSLLQKCIFSGIILLTFFVFGIFFFWIYTRPLAPVVVVGTLDITFEGHTVKTIPLSRIGSKVLTIGRGGDVDLDKDPNILEPVARLIGQMGEDRRTQAPPILQSMHVLGGNGIEVKVSISYNALTKFDKVGRRKYCRQLDDRPGGVNIGIGEQYLLNYKYSISEIRKAHNA